MVYVLVPIAFLVGIFASRWGLIQKLVRTNSRSSSPPDQQVVRPLTEAVSGCEVASDLRTTRNSLSDLLQSLEVCEQALGDDSDGQMVRSTRTELLDSMRSAQELLALSYDHLRQVRVAGDSGIEGREQLNDWLSRRLALLSRYGNSVSVGVVQFHRDSRSGALTGDHAHDLTQVMADFVRDTDRLFVYSENEFVVGLPETGLDEACLFAARCRQTMRKQFGLDARIGITEAFADDNGRTVLKRADAALHHSLADVSEPLFSHDGTGLHLISEETPLDRLMKC